MQKLENSTLLLAIKNKDEDKGFAFRKPIYNLNSPYKDNTFQSPIPPLERKVLG